jgi:succinoglycan biosynthesis protein ExoA
LTTNDSPAVSIVVPCRNELRHIEESLRSILSQQRPVGDFEVIVADGLSDDGTRAVLDKLARERAEVRIIDNPGRIVSTGLNAAIRAARGSIIVRMDAHTEYASDYVNQSVAVLEETHADAVGGPWVARGTRPLERAIAAAFQSPFCSGGGRAHDPTYEGPVDVVYLGCWHRETFTRIGLFDEALVRNQDDEFSLRLVKSGGKIWQSPRIRSWYAPRGSLKALLRQYAQYGYWKVRIIQKHRLPASPRHLVPSAFVFVLASLLLVAVWSPVARLGFMGLVAAYTTATLLASAHTAARSEWKLLPLMPVVFACYHLGYGCGFLHGIWDLIILRRCPRTLYTAISRTSRDPSHSRGDT